MAKPSPPNRASSSHRSEQNTIPLKSVEDDNPLTKIYTRSFSGHFRTLRIVGCGLLFLLYFGTCYNY